jgi:superoxide dismutase, Fe-Mn family
MAHEVPALPYDYAALEAAIDEQTMRSHHDKHHQAYVDNLNAALAGTQWENTPIEELLQSLDSLPEDKRTPVRNNGGGHYNHSLFWQWMSPDGGGDPPDGPLSVESTPNQDSPLMEGRTPILGIDVWEHAYYLRYQNRRPDYLGAWWDVVNWEAVQERLG